MQSASKKMTIIQGGSEVSKKGSYQIWSES